MNDPEALSPQEWRELRRIEQALELGPSRGSAAGEVEQFARFLAGQPVEARPGFQERLEKQLLSRTGRRRVGLGRRWAALTGRPRRLLTAGGLVLVLLALGLLAFPQARAAVAQLFGLTIERQIGPYSVVTSVLRNVPLSELPSYEYSVFTIPRQRWSMIKSAGFNAPQAGTQISLPSGRGLLVPPYLPAGYEWQDVRVANETLMSLGYPQLIGGSGGGGGGRRMPEYDRSFVSYLLGGDSDDHLLLLAQFHEPGVQGFSVRAFYVIPSTAAPGQMAVDTGGGQPVGAGPVTPTPPPEWLANTRLQIGVIVEPKAGAPGLTLAVGTAAVHEAHFGNLEAWWYQGAWNSNGEWVDDKGLTSLVWRTDTDVYQLVSDAVPLEELIKVAESLQKR